jgi:capsular exopolysaccharide synthesis family protein
VNSSPTSQPQGEADKLHFLDYWQVITKRKEVIIATTVILIFAVTVYSLVIPSKYTGVAQIRIDPTAQTMQPFVQTGYESYLRNQPLDPVDFNTHQQQIVSMPVLRKVIEGRLTETGWRCDQCGKEYSNEEVLSFGDVKCTREGCGGHIRRYSERKYPEWVPLNRKWAKDNNEAKPYTMDHAVDMLRRRINVQPERGTRLINIYYTSPDRNEVHRVANMIAEVYKQHQEEMSKTQLDEALSVVSEQVDRLLRGTATSDGLLDLQKKLDDFKKEKELVLTPGAGALIETADLNRFRANRLDLEVQITGRRERLEHIEAVDRELKISMLLGDEALDEYTQQLDELKQQLERNRALFGPEDKEVIALRSSIEQLRTQMNAKIDDVLKPTRATLKKLETEADQLDADLAAAKNDPEKHKALEEREAQVEAELATLHEQLDPLDEKRRDLMTAMLQGSQSLYDLRRLQKQQEIELSRLRGKFGKQNEEIKRLKVTISRLKESIDNEIEGVLHSLRIELKSRASEKRELDTKIAQIEKELFEKERNRTEYERRQRQIMSRRNIIDQLLAKKMMEDVRRSIPASRVTVTELAVPPNGPSRPRRLMNVLIGVVVGLTVGTSLAYFIEYLDTSVKTIDDLERSLSMPILGVIPQRVKLLTEVTHKSPAYEAYRMLWTNIEFARQDSKLRTVLITSGGVGEGKTTSLVNLGIVAAREGNRVLIIDSDFRRPRVHKLLGVSNHEGLTDVLMRNADPDRVAVPTQVPGLSVLPSGKLPPSAMGLLNSRNMRECIEHLHDKYDIILFDSPPVIGVSDASVLAGLVDRIVLVVEYRKYPKTVATRAKKILENVGGRILGGVINNLNIVKEDYYYYSQVYHYFQASGEKTDEEGAAAEGETPAEDETETASEEDGGTPDDQDRTT